METQTTAVRLPLREITAITENAVKEVNKIPRNKLTLANVKYIAWEKGISPDYLLMVGRFFDSETKIKNKKHGKKNF